MDARVYAAIAQHRAGDKPPPPNKVVILGLDPRTHASPSAPSAPSDANRRVTTHRRPQPPYRGSVVAPIRSRSMARAAWRPSRIAQTTSDWPRRLSPAAYSLSTEVR